MSDKHVTWQQACEAIQDLGDYASPVGGSPINPRATLYRFVEQQKTAADEIERLRSALQRIVRMATARRRPIANRLLAQIEGDAAEALQSAAAQKEQA